MGILALEVHIPDDRLSADAIERSSGVPGDVLARKRFRQKPVLNAEAPIFAMGVAATTKLLQEHAIDRREVELLAYASTGLHDHRFWSPAAKLQQELGLEGVFSFEVTNGCHAGNVALSLVSGHLRRPGAKRYGLVVVCDALSRVVDHANPAHVSIFNFADAASAILIDRESKKMEIIGHDSVTDGRFSDYLALGAAGTVEYRLPALKQSLRDAYIENYVSVIGAATAKAGHRVGAIKHFLMSQGDPQLFGDIAKRLRVSDDRFVRTSETLGHLGGSDVFYGLKLLLDEGRLNPGDLVMLASSAIGFSWGATLLRI
jgi:3-oxoacyl-[acyl-carrier-protein] synthase-3